MKKLISLTLALLLVFALTACSAPANTNEATTLKVGATPAPHAEILEVIKDDLANEGIKLEIIEFTDYVLPNEALTGGDIDANFFQHQPYLDTYNAEHGTDIISAASIHYEPLGVYPGRTATIEEIADGAEIAIPNDGSNEARALYLLESQGLITVDKATGFNATVLDIIDNPKNLTITEVEAAQLPLILPDVDLAVINGNFAIASKIADTVLVTEAADSESAVTYANIVAVTPGNEESPAIKALIKALQSDEVKEFINDTYGISVVPMF